MGDAISSEKKEEVAPQANQFVNINITVAPGVRDSVVTDGNQIVVTTFTGNEPTGELKEAPDSAKEEVTEAPIACKPESIDGKDDQQLEDRSVEPKGPVALESAKQEVTEAPIACKPELIDGKDDQQLEDRFAELNGPVALESAKKGVTEAPIACKPELIDGKDDQQLEDRSVEPKGPVALESAKQEVREAPIACKPESIDGKDDQQLMDNSAEPKAPASIEPAEIDSTALRATDPLDALTADVERLKNRIDEMDAARLTVVSVKEDNTTRRFGAVDEERIITDDALWAACAENEGLKLRLAQLENSSQSTCRSAGDGTIFIAADFMRGCNVSSVLVDGRDTLDAAWFYRYITTDSAGRLFFADVKNHVVRRIDLDGKDTAIAGNGGPGFRDGRGKEVQFCCPMSVDVTADGTLYVADWGNDALRRISVDGNVTTVAGNGFRGFQNGKGRAALFCDPHDCAVGPDGTVYVVDVSNNAIRRVARDGTVTTMAGNGTAGLKDSKGKKSQLNFPAGVAVDRAGNVVVADSGNHTIRRISLNGVVKTVAGNGTPGFKDGTNVEATFRNPNDVAVGIDGAIYVADSGNRVIRCIDPNGTVTTIAGTGIPGYRDGTGAQAMFSCPTGLTVSPDGSIYVMDLVNKRIRHITPLDAKIPVKGG